MIIDTPCQARITQTRADGSDACSRMAKHEHYAFDTGTRLMLCTQHRDCLLKRERLGSSGDLLDQWTQRAAR